MENKQDITTLTIACIGSSKAKPTAALYICIEFLVSNSEFLILLRACTNSLWIVFTSQDFCCKWEDKGEAFWKSVDAELSTWRKSFPVASQLQ
jgi:hypothetical protein